MTPKSAFTEGYEMKKLGVSVTLLALMVLAVGCAQQDAPAPLKAVGDAVEDVGDAATDAVGDVGPTCGQECYDWSLRSVHPIIAPLCQGEESAAVRPDQQRMHSIRASTIFSAECPSPCMSSA